MKAKIKAFWKKYWKITLVAVLLVTIVGAVVAVSPSPFKKNADDLGIIEMHENVKYAFVDQVFANPVLPVTSQKRLDAILNTLHDAEFREILWVPRNYTGPTIDFYTTEQGEKAAADDMHRFIVQKDLFNRCVLIYINGGRTRYFTCTTFTEFGKEVREAIDMYTRH